MASPAPIPLDSLTPQYVPVPSSGPGPTVMVPKGDDNAPITIDRINDAFDALPKPQKRELRPGEVATGTARVPDTFSDAARIAVDYGNQMLAGAQYVTPDIKSHQKNYLGDVTSVDDSGKMYFKDDKGKEQPVDSSHVVLQDPDDNKFKIFQRSADTDEGPIRGRLLALGRWVGSAFATGAPQVSKAAAPAVEAALRQGVELPKSVVHPAEASTLARVPLVGSPIAQASEEGIASTEQAAKNLGTLPTGQAVSAERAGQVAETGLTNYAAPKVDGQPGILQAKIDAQYDNVRKLIDPSVVAEPKNAQQFGNQLTLKYGKADLGWPATLANDILGPITKPGGVDFDSLKLARQRVGEMIQDPTVVPGGVSQSELKGLYGALSDDLGELVNKAGGPDAVKAFNRANTYNKAANTRREALQGILIVKNDEGIFGTLQRLAGSTNSADAKLLAQAKKSLTPDEWDHVAAGVLGRLGKVKQANGDTFDMGKWVQDYQGMSDAGKNMLFGGQGYSDLRHAIDDIGAIGAQAVPTMKRTAGAAGGLVHSGLGAIGIVEALRQLGEMVYGEPVEKALVQGGVAVGAGAAARARAWWLASPITAKYAAKWLQQYKVGIMTKNTAIINNATQALKESLQGQPEAGNVIP